MYNLIHYSNEDDIDSVTGDLKVSFPEGNGFRPTSFLKQPDSISTTSASYTSDKSDLFIIFCRTFILNLRSVACRRAMISLRSRMILDLP